MEKDDRHAGDPPPYTSVHKHVRKQLQLTWMLHK